LKVTLYNDLGLQLQMIFKKAGYHVTLSNTQTFAKWKEVNLELTQMKLGT